MPGSPGIFNKNDGDTIYAADFNNIQSATDFLLGTGLADSGYGQTVNSAQVAGDQLITVSQWNTLRSDLLKVRQHQTGVDESAGLAVPTDSTTITNEFVNDYKTFATTCSTNRLTVASNQTTETNFFTPRTRNTAWNGKLTHTVTITFASANAARWFFNAGGAFKFSASRANGSSTSKNTAWTNMLSDMGTITFNHGGTTYSGTGAAGGYPKTAIGWYGLTTSDQTLFIKPAVAGNYNENEYRIKARKDANDNTATVLTFTIEFDDVDTGDQITGGVGGGGLDGSFLPLGPAVDENVDGDLTSTVRIYRPTGTNVELVAPSYTESGL